MATLQELIRGIEDLALRKAIAEAVEELTQNKKFGLVFEEHLPDYTPLYGVPIKEGSLVVQKFVVQKKTKKGAKREKESKATNHIYAVLQVDGDNALCEYVNDDGEKDQEIFSLKKLVAVARFNEPIYPYLHPIASVCNAPKSDLWHTLIEADNYHALQLLQYLYAGKVDCIYIDPPYNKPTSHDWKYNNNFVDSGDSYRHSKWLSMMEKRLRLAKELLNPEDSVLIVTIDEKEYLHLGCLLEQMFPEARIQMVSVAIHSAGVSRSEFSRTDEYYFYVFMGDAKPTSITLGQEWNSDGTKRQSDVRWESMLRSGNNGRRIDRPNLFYPVLFDIKTRTVAGFGDSIPKNKSGCDYKPPEGTVAVLPYASDGSEACWRISSQKALELQKQGAFDWGEFKGEKTTLKYLKPGELAKIERGEYAVVGHKDNGAMIISAEGYQTQWVPGTQWHVSTHQAGGAGGSMLIKALLGEKRFDFPKSLYAVRDSIRFITASKPNALVVDFFAGSGTTLHAVNLLNAEDGGHRRCIMVTNNEVSESEADELARKGYLPGDPEWEKLGIARYVTWPRTVCSIEGHDVDGKRLKGNYFGSERQMADGFEANAIYFKLGFLDKTSVALGKQFAALLSILWMKAGAVGKCPSLSAASLPRMLIYPENHFAVLLKESAYSEFVPKLTKHPEIQTIYFVTDSSIAYEAMAGRFWDAHKSTYQLYKNYLENFKINIEKTSWK